MGGGEEKDGSADVMWTREADSQLSRCKNTQMTAKVQDLFLDVSGDYLESRYNPGKE